MSSYIELLDQLAKERRAKETKLADSLREVPEIMKLATCFAFRDDQVFEECKPRRQTYLILEANRVYGIYLNVESILNP